MHCLPRKPIGRKPPAQFGDPVRTQILRALVDGPVRLRELARRAGAGYRSTVDISRRLQRIGVVRVVRCKRKKTYALLDPGFPASKELKKYLCTLASAGDTGYEPVRDVSHIWHRRSPRPVEPAHPELLFGSPIRTRTLALVAVQGELTVKEIAESLGEDSARLGDEMDFLVSIGLLERRRHRIRRTYSLPASRIGGTELRRLLRRMARAIPELDVGAHVLRVPGDVRGNKNREPTSTHNLVAQRLPFMTPAQARLLTFVAIKPRTVREMSTAFGVSWQSVRSTVHFLTRSGPICVTRPSRHFEVSLNPAFPAFVELRATLGAALGHAREEAAGGSQAGIPDVFGHALRFRVLAALAARGEADKREIIALASPRIKDSAIGQYLALLVRRMLITRTPRGYRFAPTQQAAAIARLMSRYSHLVLDTAK